MAHSKFQKGGHHFPSKTKMSVSYFEIQFTDFTVDNFIK